MLNLSWNLVGGPFVGLGRRLDALEQKEYTRGNTRGRVGVVSCFTSPLSFAVSHFIGQMDDCDGQTEEHKPQAYKIQRSAMPCKQFCTTKSFVAALLCLLAFQVTPSLSSELIRGFTLIDVSTGQDVRPIVNGDTIDKNDYIGIPLTIRVDIASNETVSWVRIVWNDGLTRTKATPPYYLAGESGGEAVEATELSEVGTYTIEAIVLDQRFNEIEGFDIRFFVVDSTIEASPTATPLSIHDVKPYRFSSDGVVNGELKLWHKVTIGFSGIITGETNNIENPFLDLRLDVTFEHKASAKKYVVPGFYACDGNAANTGASSGFVWLVHFRPDEIGTWTYNASHVEGENVAVDDTFAVSASFFDGATGLFEVADTDKVAPDLRAKGRLQYVGEHHLRFANGEYFLKAGADSPENLLAYEDFDNTPNYGGRRKSWAPHVDDYQEGDPTWMGGKGRGLIGAINYLASKEMNAISFLTMNVQWDDRNVFPYRSETDFDRMDCSKLDQWDVVFDHAERKGMFLHFKTQERENDDLLDGGNLGINRKLYYRELISRFGHHLALNYNLGEENENTNEQRLDFINYFQQTDPYKSPIVLHTWPGHQERHYSPLLGVAGFTGVSIQTAVSNGFDETLKWVQRSENANQKWVVAIDEQSPAGIGVAPDAVDPQHDSIRSSVLWANLLAGGAGVEYYFGYDNDNSDLSCEDWRSRGNMWDQSRYALEFFSDIPFWRMINANDLVSGRNWCLVEPSDYSHVVVYLPHGGSADVDLSASGTGHKFAVNWFNPREGGNLQVGSLANIISSSTTTPLGMPPSQSDKDWAVKLQCLDCFPGGINLGPPDKEGVDLPLSPSVQETPQAPPAVAPVSESSSRSKIGGLIAMIVTLFVA